MIFAKEPSADWRAMASEWQQHWRVGLASFLVLGLSQGAFQSLFSLFIIPLQTAFGWSRGQIALAYNATLATALLAPFFGYVIDKYGARRIMLSGLIASACVYAGLAMMSGPIWIFYLLHVAAASVGLSTSGLTCSRVVSATFVKSRGLSLALARSGYALASAGLPVVMFSLIMMFGWRAGYVMEAALVLAVALPATYFWIDNKSLEVTASPAGKAPSASALALVRDRRIWILCFGALLSYAPANALMSQLHPILTGKGVSPLAAAKFIGVAGIASFLGAIVTGILVDRFWAPAIACLFSIGAAVGSLILMFSPALLPAQAFLSTALTGLGLGAELDVVAFLVARYFGIKLFSTAYGIAIFFIAAGGAAGASALGLSFDHYNSYDPALGFLALSFCLSGIVYLMLGPYPTVNEHDA